MAAFLGGVYATDAGMLCLWDPAAFADVANYATWEQELCEDKDIVRHIKAGHLVPVNTNRGRDGAFAVVVRLGDADQPAALTEREASYILAESDLYLLRSSGRICLSGLEHVEGQPGRAVGCLPALAGQYAVKVYFIAWDDEPGMKDRSHSGKLPSASTRVGQHACSRANGMSTATITVGPEDHGRPMRLEDFDRAEGKEGHLYELSRGVIIVSDVPRPSHARVVSKVRRLAERYQDEHPRKIYDIYGSGECKILLWNSQSERHPDLSIYTTPPPCDDASVWSIWVPAVVMEVISPDSLFRDLQEKVEDYLAFGVQEYWIVDPAKETLTVLIRRAGRWKEKVFQAGEAYECQKFKGLRLALSELLAA
jgi:Uma2 family endonuclease